MLHFTKICVGGDESIECEPASLVIAGWAARDAAAVQHHIDELAAIGVAPPTQVPLFYRGSQSLLTQSDAIQVLGADTSGEIEPVIVALHDGLWLTVGSDHTDRKAEAQGVALSKQLCAKPVARELWRLDDVIAYWDELELRAWALIAGVRVKYQEGALATLRTPSDLIARYAQGAALSPGTVMFGGTLGAIGGVRPSTRFEMELRDPRTGCALRHAYDIDVLPVVA